MAGIIKVDRVQSDSNLAFQVAGANVAYMDSTGLSMTGGTLSLGGTTVIPAVGQIKFPATQNASADANTLDDYEEGTWTPSIIGSVSNPTVTYVTSGSYTYGHYVKVGQLIHASFSMNWSGLSGGSGLFFIGGLPFSTCSLTFGGGSSAAYCSGFTYNLAFYQDGSTARLVVMKQGAQAYVNISDVPATGHIIGGVTYRTYN